MNLLDRSSQQHLHRSRISVYPEPGVGGELGDIGIEAMHQRNICEDAAGGHHGVSLNVDDGGGCKSAFRQLQKADDPAVEPLPERQTSTRPAMEAPFRGCPASITIPVVSSTPRLKAIPSDVTSAAPSAIPPTSPCPLNFRDINLISKLGP